MSNFKSAHLLKVVLVNTLLLALTAIVLELCFGRWLRNSPITAIPEIARSAGKTYRFRTHGVTGEDVSVVFERDNHGLRGFENKKKPLTLVLGGSTGIEQNVPLERTWAEVLEAGLRQHGYDWEVANASVSGHTLFGNQYAIRNWLSKIPLRPNLILIYYGHNDAVYTMNGTGPAGRDFSSVGSFDFKEQFLRKSALVLLYRELVGNYRSLVTGNTHLYDYQPSRLPDQADNLPRLEVPAFRVAATDPALASKSFRLLYDELQTVYPSVQVAFVAQSNPNCRFLSRNSYLSRGGRNSICEKLASLHGFVEKSIEISNNPLISFIPLYLANPYDRYGSSDAIHTNSRGSVSIGKALVPEVIRLLPEGYKSR